MSKDKDNKIDKEEVKPMPIKTAADLQRLRLEKLMKNPEKPVVIPPRPKGKSLPAPPDFVRNVMGSSAGAGSGEFHVYRHLRRKEYSRQKFIQEKSEKEKLDEEYHRKLEENKRKAEMETAKKRAKRLKKKQKDKMKKTKISNTNVTKKMESESDSNSDEDVQNDSQESHDSVKQISPAKLNNASQDKQVETASGTGNENSNSNLCLGSRDTSKTSDDISSLGT